MKTVLVVGQPEALATEVRNLLEANTYRVLPYSEVWEAEPLLRQGFIDLCLIDAELPSVQPLRVVEQIHLLAPKCPLFVYVGEQRQPWEEEAYLLGITHVFTKPVRARILLAMIQRLWPEPPPVEAPVPRTCVEDRTNAALASASSKHTLEVLRDFSGILCHSLCSEALLKQFLLLLREIIGINRAAIFLRPSPTTLAMTGKGDGDRRMHAASSIGISQGLLQHFDLSLNSGIGGQVYRRGHILRMQSEETRQDSEILKEFELLGAEVAVPVWDRESLIGVAVFDGRLTGEPFTSEELSLIFLLLEQLGLALKNTWLYDQLAAGHQIMQDIMNQTASGCVVVGRNLEILHANQAARKLTVEGKKRTSGRFEFSDLPQPLAGRIFEAIKTSQTLPPFVYHPPAPSAGTYQVTINLFQHNNHGTPNAVLVMIEDVTQQEKAKLFEVQGANHRLLKTMAAQLAHEIGNSLAPLSTHQQLFTEKIKDPEFYHSLEHVLAAGVRRIGRLSNQMLYLAMTECDRTDMVAPRVLLEEAFADAKACFGGDGARLSIEEESPSVPIHVSQRALRHAFSEVLLNSLQANSLEHQIRALIRVDNLLAGELALVIEVVDSGSGFTTEAANKAFDPFYTTRAVGLGLGLTVARKIIEAHQGRIELAIPAGFPYGMVRMILPFNRPAEATKLSAPRAKP